MSLARFLSGRAPRPNPGPFRVEALDADHATTPPAAWHVLGTVGLHERALALAAGAPARLAASGARVVLVRLVAEGDPERAPLWASVDGSPLVPLPPWPWPPRWPAALRWVEGRSMVSAWLEAPSASWLVAALAPRLPETRRAALLADCVELVLPYVAPGERRPRRAVEAARRWAQGEIHQAEALAAAAASAAAAGPARHRNAARLAAEASSFLTDPTDPARFIEATALAVREAAAAMGAPPASLARVTESAQQQMLWRVRTHCSLGDLVRALLGHPST